MFASAFNVHYVSNLGGQYGLGNGLDIRGKGNIIDVEISKDGSVIAMCFGANSESSSVTDKGSVRVIKLTETYSLPTVLPTSSSPEESSAMRSLPRQNKWVIAFEQF